MIGAQWVEVYSKDALTSVTHTHTHAHAQGELNIISQISAFMIKCMHCCAIVINKYVSYNLDWLPHVVVLY
jgi:hypothetical protein